MNSCCNDLLYGDDEDYRRNFTLQIKIIIAMEHTSMVVWVLLLEPKDMEYVARPQHDEAFLC